MAFEHWFQFRVKIRGSDSSQTPSYGEFPAEFAQINNIQGAKYSKLLVMCQKRKLSWNFTQGPGSSGARDRSLL